ncbi:Rnase Y domain-containing protein, partial [bacterium]|nr:Rnase Y domain-containing protein [bacterium]
MRAINPITIYLIVGVVALFIGLTCGTLLQTIRAGSKAVKTIKDAELKAAGITASTEKDCYAIHQKAEVEAKEYLITQMKELDRETRLRNNEFNKSEERFLQRGKTLDNQQKFIEKRERTYKHKSKELSNRQRSLDKLENKRQELLKEQEVELARIAGLSQQQAKEQIIELMEDEARKDAAIQIKRIIDDATDQADMKAKEIIAT